MKSPTLVLQYPRLIVGGDGIAYIVRAFADPLDTVWEGWLVFFPENGGKPISTHRETTQPDLAAVRYWASGLEPIYLEGALERARRIGTGAWAAP
jgi:hypothetical protein